MSDEETKQLLRDILAVQREQLARFEQQDKLFQEHLQRQEKQYAESAKLHAEATAQYQVVQPWSLAIRLVTMLGVVVLLGYLVVEHFHG